MKKHRKIFFISIVCLLIGVLAFSVSASVASRHPGIHSFEKYALVTNKEEAYKLANSQVKEIDYAMSVSEIYHELLQDYMRGKEDVKHSEEELNEIFEKLKEEARAIANELGIIDLSMKQYRLSPDRILKVSEDSIMPYEEQKLNQKAFFVDRFYLEERIRRQDLGLDYSPEVTASVLVQLNVLYDYIEVSDDGSTVTMIGKPSPDQVNLLLPLMEHLSNKEDEYILSLHQSFYGFSDMVETLKQLAS